MIGPAEAEESYASVLFQNDLFFGRDGGGYTNGFFLSHLGITSPGEGSIEPALLPQPILAWLGLQRTTLAAMTLGQVLVTPRDISRRVPDPSDAPYIGALMLSSTDVWIHDDVGDVATIGFGVTGPAAGGATVQRFVHRLTGSTTPEGWDSQVGNRVLFGIERYRAQRWTWGSSETGTPSGDVTALGGGALGNFESSIRGALMLRYGRGLERSFSTVTRAASLGSDPFVVGSGWFGYVGLSANRIFNHAGVGGDAPSINSSHLRNERIVATAGFAYGWDRSSLSFSLQSANPLVTSDSRRQSYGSITYVVRLL